jgi:hypothetical protein
LTLRGYGKLVFWSRSFYPNVDRNKGSAGLGQPKSVEKMEKNRKGKGVLPSVSVPSHAEHPARTKKFAGL